MRTTVGGLALAALVTVAPATAESDAEAFQFSSVPCGIACDDSLWFLNTDVDGDGVPEVYFDQCSHPGAFGYGELVLVAPADAHTLVVEADPSMWDMVACAGNGEELSRGVRGEGDECADLATDGRIGCPEKIVIPAHGGRTYVVRGFNVSDPFDLTGTYQFLSY